MSRASDTSRAGAPPAAGSFLERMAASAGERVARARRTLPLADLQRRAAALPPPPPLRRQGFDVIAEVKLGSPALGRLGDAEEIAARVRAYVAGGAAAISVLTEPTAFAGSLEHLRGAARVAGDVPVLCKDFLVDPYQVFEARAAGAAGVLLIAELLDDALLDALLDAAHECRMFVLLESFAPASLERALRRASERVLPGVNCRDLRTLDVEPERLVRAARHFGTETVVAESGLHDVRDVATIAAAGYALALVGTALMRADWPAERLRAMVTAGRRARCG